LNGANFES